MEMYKMLHMMLGVQEWGWPELAPLKMDHDDEAWEIIIKEAQACGINAILLDIGEGVRFESHPELAQPESWSQEKVHYEVKRLREMGISLIPLLNFSAAHHFWMRDYAKMMSTEPYYKVCRDLIQEAYTLFDKPEYIHLGMDEEDDTFRLRNLRGLVSMRRDKLFWHDLNFLCDCVRETGSTPAIWADHLHRFPEKFRENIAKDVLLIPWNYMALKKEHFSPIDSKPKYKDFYAQEPYVHMNLQYVEDDPMFVDYMNTTLPAARDGYNLLPMSSLCNLCECSIDDMVDYFWSDNMPRERLRGFSIAPWKTATMENVDEIFRNIHQLRDACEKYCK